MEECRLFIARRTKHAPHGGPIIKQAQVFLKKKIFFSFAITFSFKTSGYQQLL
jgi:hypothetical protein